MSRLSRFLVVVAATFGLPAAAYAAFAWKDTRIDRSAWVLDSAAVAPDGTALLFGWNGSTEQMVVRPPGGELGAMVDVPVGDTGAGDVPVVAFDGSGNALIARSGQIAYRSADGTFGATQTLTGFGQPTQISMAPTGEALLANDSGGKVNVAVRPAGANAQVDLSAGAVQHLANPDGEHDLTLIGLQLDPDGAAIIVMRYANAIYESVRAAGASAFGNVGYPPIPPELSIQSAHPVGFASSPDGHAILTYVTPQDADAVRVAAVYRAPGGAFGLPAEIGRSTSHPPNVGNVFAAVDEDGDGIVTWTGGLDTDVFNGCMTPQPSYGLYGSLLHDGVFGPASALTSAAGAERSGIQGAIGAGHRVAIAYRLNHAGANLCSSTDDSQDLAIRTFMSGPSGLTVEDDHTIATTPPGESGQLNLPAFGSSPLALSTGGTLVTANLQNMDDGNVQTLHVHEDPDALVTPTPTVIATTTATATFTATPTAKPSPTPTPTVKPLVAKDLVTPAPITSSRPSQSVQCPATAASECAFNLSLIAKTGAFHARAAKAAIKFGSGSAKVPAGRKKRVRITLTKAGKKAVKHKPIEARLVIRVTAGGKTSTATLKTTIGQRRKK